MKLLRKMYNVSKVTHWKSLDNKVLLFGKKCILNNKLVTLPEMFKTFFILNVTQ